MRPSEPIFPKAHPFNFPSELENEQLKNEEPFDIFEFLISHKIIPHNRFIYINQ